MTSSPPRKPLWDAIKRAAYESGHEKSHSDLMDQREGRNIADALVYHWNSLNASEAALLEYLVLIERRIVLARQANKVINGLVEKGFLSPPPGVGALFLRYNQTTYSVPHALWQALNNAEQRHLFAGDNDPAARLNELKLQFSELIDVTMHNDTGFVELPRL